DILRGLEDGILVFAGKHHYAIRVAAHDVARSDPDAADRDRPVDGFHLDAVLAGAHPAATGEDRIPQVQAQRHVAAHAVDHRPGNAATMGDLGQDVAPHRGIFPAAVVQHDDLARRHVVDEV